MKYLKGYAVAASIVFTSVGVGVLGTLVVQSMDSKDQDNDRVTLANISCEEADIDVGIKNIAFTNAVWATTQFAGLKDINVTYDEVFTQHYGITSGKKTCIQDSQNYLGRQLIIAWSMNSDSFNEAEKSGLVSMIDAAYNTQFVTGEPTEP